jgi:hypothetical protein
MNFKNILPAHIYNDTNYIANNIQKYIDQSSYLTNESNKSELYEKALVSNFLQKDAKILELGGGCGHVSDIIQKIINNKDNHIIIEPEKGRADDLIKKHYKVFNGIISNEHLYLENKFVTVNKKTKKSEKIKNITNVNKLQEKYNIIFDTIIADCEGALPKIFEENPQLYDQINFIQIEYDWLRTECTEFRNKLISKGFKSRAQLPLHWTPSKGKGCYNENKEIIGHEILTK